MLTLNDAIRNYEDFGIELRPEHYTQTNEAASRRRLLKRLFVYPSPHRSPRGFAVGLRFPKYNETHIAAHYVIDQEYVHGACLLAFLKDQYEAAGGNATYKEGFDAEQVWEDLVECGCWTIERRSDLDGNAFVFDSTTGEGHYYTDLTGLDACIVCGNAILLM
jgi:hypothetical protein